ncbi:multiple epidermal growth factor-like domains protein 11 [Saccostrea cucullata]|uniref:multiple epidermal growth factor-like domains protein 11 n=1 Tax=Saccostrea cuccullata TaxID=36930 RepID=UPI002ECFCF59
MHEHGMMTICFIVIAVDFSHEYENLAFEKSTWQSTIYDPTVGSEKAVDGFKSDFSYSGKQCSISKDNKKTATWWVDLGRILSINNIVIYYRTDGNTWNASNYYTGRFLGFFIYVSNTTDRHVGHICFHDTYYTRSTIPPIVNISCPIHGRYVIYYNERLPDIHYPSEYSADAYIELCEVEVYGCSMPRRYGPDCSLPCPLNCKEYCHMQTGICFECKPGKKGAFCEQDCDGRTYGLGCRLLCGNCFNSKQCHHVNGSCFDGCDAGYKGPLCKTEKLFLAHYNY